MRNKDGMQTHCIVSPALCNICERKMSSEQVICRTLEVVMCSQWDNIIADVVLVSLQLVIAGNQNVIFVTGTDFDGQLAMTGQNRTLVNSEQDIDMVMSVLALHSQFIFIKQRGGVHIKYGKSRKCKDNCNYRKAKQYDGTLLNANETNP